MIRQPRDEWHFTGAKATYGVFGNNDAIEGQSVIPPFTTDLTDATHGLLAGTDKNPSLIWIEGTTNYDGLRKIVSIPDVNSIMIAASYVAEELAGTETWKSKIGYDDARWEFLGFYLTLSAVGADVENFDVNIDANIGSTFDNLVYRKAMSGVTYINNMFDEPRPMEAGDKIDFVWANAGAKTYGLKVFTRRLV